MTLKLDFDAFQELTDAEFALVDRFSSIMARQLVVNQHKTPWTEESIGDLVPRMEKKYAELMGDYVATGHFDTKKLADLSNYSAMIADLEN